MSKASNPPTKRKGRKVYMPDGKEFTAEHLDVPRIQEKAMSNPKIPILTNDQPAEINWEETTADAYWLKKEWFADAGRIQEASRKLGGRNAAAVRKENTDARNKNILSRFDAMTQTDERDRAGILARQFELSASQIRKVIKKLRARANRPARIKS